jgi:hypothetical protein
MPKRSTFFGLRRLALGRTFDPAAYVGINLLPVRSRTCAAMCIKSSAINTSRHARNAEGFISSPSANTSSVFG